MITRPQTAALRGRDQLNLAPGAYMPPANHWLRMWLGWQDYLECYEHCDGGLETATVSVGLTETALLAANHLGRGVEITNNSAFRANVYEDGILVAVALGNKTTDLPLNGLLAITAKALPNNSDMSVLVGATITMSSPAPWSGTPVASVTIYGALDKEGDSFYIFTFWSDAGHTHQIYTHVFSGGAPFDTANIVFAWGSLNFNSQFGNLLAQAQGPTINFTVVRTVVPQTDVALVATRYLRCACGDTFSYGGYDDEPVGAFLL